MKRSTEKTLQRMIRDLATKQEDKDSIAQI